jgi:hypothetical protein
VKCDKCFSARWLYAEPSFDDSKKLSSQWRPFSRDYWMGLGKPLVGVLLAAKSLKPCDCNPDKLAPWAKVFQQQTSNAAAGAPADDTPF